MIRARKRLENCEIEEQLQPKTKKSKDSNLKTNSLPIEDDADSHIRALKHENLSKELFMHHWKSCVGERVDFIKNSNVNDVIKKWPQYKQSYGYQLVG